MDKTAASPNFLARLAPGARAAAPSVRAALPSRFAPREAQAALDEEGAERGAAEAPTGATMQPHARIDAPEGAAASTPGPPRPTAVVVQAIVQAAATPRSVAAGAPAASAAPATLREADPETAPPGRPLSRADATSPATRGDPSGPPPQRAGQPAAAPRPFAAPPIPTIDARPPLSEATLAQRTAAPLAGAPATVQVTIDRIDVRAPAAAPADRKPAPRSRAPTGVSLADYLRQRQKARNGEGS